MVFSRYTPQEYMAQTEPSELDFAATTRSQSYAWKLMSFRRLAKN